MTVPEDIVAEPAPPATKAPRRSWREFLDLSWLTGRKDTGTLGELAAKHGCTPAECDAIERMAAGDHRPAPAPPRARPARLLEVREINFAPPPARPRPVDALPGLLADRPGKPELMRQRYIRRADTLLPMPPLPPPDPDAVIRAKRAATVKLAPRRGPAVAPAPSEATPDVVAAPAPGTSKKPRGGREKKPAAASDQGQRREAAMAWLRPRLAGGPVAFKAIKAEALAAGHAVRTCRRALSVLGGRIVHGARGTTAWRLVKQ